MNRMSTSVRIRLGIMMFLQYMLFAVWFVPLAAYLTKMGVEGWKKAIIMSSMPLGCLVSPIICMIADRHFASQRVLTVLNVACAVLFFLAAEVVSPILLFVILLVAMFCYMPTWPLTNAIAMANYPSEKFPQIRALGSIGWVASLVFSVVALKVYSKKIDDTAIPLLCGAGTALIAALFNLTLPNTPPPAKGKPTSIVDALGLRALGLMKDFNFALFIIVSTLVMIPFTTYFSFGSQFFDYQGFTLVTATMNWGQLVEMFLMLLVPLSLTRVGVKWTIVIGLAGLVARYIIFWAGGVYDQTLLYYMAILIHGVIFSFFFVGGQVYVDKKAPAEIRAQAQGLIGLLCFGIGWLAGNFFNAALIDKYTVVQYGGNKVTNWVAIWIITTVISAMLLGAFVLLFRDDVKTSEPVSADQDLRS
jgi:nucleoside transporter